MNEIARNVTAAEEWRPSAAINPARLDYLWTLTERIAGSAIVPESLRGERKGQQFEPFEPEVVRANVFAVVEQADRWDISPFALLQAASIVRGKLCFEGKVIAGVLESKFGIKLHLYYRGDPGTDSYHIYLCDQELPDEVLAELVPRYRHDRFKIMDGSVAAWKTTGNGSPWRPDTFADMLAYRGARQWTRINKSSVLIGVLADDEVQQLALENAAQNAIPIGQRFAAAPAKGFSPGNVAAALEHKPQVAMEIIDKETGEVIETNPGAQPDAKVTTTSPGPKAKQGTADAPTPSTATASAAPADDSAGGAGSTATGGSRPQETPSSSATATAADDGTGGDVGTAPARISADIFRDYHSALARMESEANVTRAHTEFWKGRGVKIGHPDDIQLGTSIKQAHLDRVAGKLDGEYVAREIATWIKVTTEVAL